MASNDKPTTKKKKLNNLQALSMLDNIIQGKTIQDNDDSDVEDNINDNSNKSNNVFSELDNISISSDESNKNIFDDISKTLDNIIISSKEQHSVNKQNKSISVVKEMRNPNVDIYQSLSIDDTLFTDKNVPIKILENLSSFHKMPTYEVRYNHSKHIFRWYNKLVYKDLKSFRKHLENLSNSREYSNVILKPKIFSKSNENDCFGCIYPDITFDYFALNDIINGYIIQLNDEKIPIRKNIKFKSLDAMVNASINIAKIFLEINQKDQHFTSFYEENLFININNGDVLIDISKSIPNEIVPFNVDKECVYLAPEVLSGSSKPNKYSDNYTLAVVLFRLFFHDHPLEGKAVIDDICLDFKQKAKYYSDNAVFILNPNDTSNRPVRGVHYTVLSMWHKYPKYLKDAFLKTFCDNIFVPEERYTIENWLGILLQLKSSILPCICGRTDFAFLYEFTSEGFYTCQKCGSKYHSLYFKRKGFNIPIYDGNKIYSIFFTNKTSNFEEVMGEVIENKIHENLFGMKNVSKIDWICSLSNGDLKNLKPNDVLPVFTGNNLDFYGSIAEFDFIE